MKRVFPGVTLFTISLLFVSTMSAGAVSTPSSLPGDTNQDNSISCSEAKQKTTERFEKMDTNSDKQITMTEFEAGTTKNFEAMDADKSGAVDVQEYLVSWCGAPAKDIKPAKKATKSNKQSLHKSMDENKNGKVTKEECVVFWSIRFADIDGNKDNSITKNEFDTKVVEWFSISDINKDGSVTTVEFTDRWVGKCQAEQLKKAMTSK